MVRDNVTTEKQLERSAEEDSREATSASVREFLSRMNLSAAREKYREQGQFVCFNDFVPSGLVRRMAREAEALRPYVQRKVIPGYKKSGSVSFYRLSESAPAILEFYRDPALIGWLSELTGAVLQSCPDSDPHAAALYYYTEAGDHIGFHFDSSHYKGARYTVLIGLVDDSTGRLICDLHRRDPKRATEHLELATPPGTFTFFQGDCVWHSVSPVGPGETRIVLTMEYVTDASMSPVRRLVSDLKDAMTYFGFRELLRARRRAL